MPTSKPLRILHLIDSGGLYGAEKVLLALASECRTMGDEPIVGTMVAPGDGGDPLGDAARQRGLRHKAFHMPDGFRIRGLREILRFARDEAVDIVHTHGYRPNILLAMVPRRLRPCPVVTTLHGWTATGRVGKLAVHEALERMVLSRLDGVVIVSEAMRGRLPSATRSAARFIRNGIETRGIAGDALTGAKGSATRMSVTHRPVVIAAGRLSPEKGFDVLLEAVAVLCREGIRLDVRIAGDGQEAGRLRARSAALGLEESVRFLGFVDEMGSLYEQADVLVIPSQTEGLPLVLLEAMAAEVPVVATRVGQVPEVLEEGQCGLIVSPGSVSQLANALRAVITEREQARERADLAKARIFATYSAETMSEQYSRMYQGLAG